MLRKRQIAIIIPNWNGSALIAPCLSSLLGQSCAADIIVVDNGSSDASVFHIKKAFPLVTVIELPKNLGFAGGVNVGIRYAMDRDYKFIGLFNNDAVAEENWLERLVMAADKFEGAGIVTGKLMSMDKKHLDSAGELFYSWGVPGPRGRGQKDSVQFDKSEYVFGATAGASLYRTQLFKDIGLFDDAFFAYYEDTDLSFRAQLFGWKVRYEPTAIAYHHINATSGKIKGFHAYQTMKNLPLVVWKNIPLRLLPACLFKFSVMYMVIFWGVSKNRGWFYALKGVLAGLWLLPKKIVARYTIQKNRNVDDEYIKSVFTYDLPPGTGKLSKLSSAILMLRGGGRAR